MKALRIIRNYLCYCGIEKEEYDAIKKDAYVSNFIVWRILHVLLTVVFAVMLALSLSGPMLKVNLIFYLVSLVYFAAVTAVFFMIDKRSVGAQFLIYLSISFLFLLGALITQNKPGVPATTFIVMLIITPMLMIDRPFFMGIELAVASAVFLIWMYDVKPFEVWKIDFVNTLTYTAIGFFLHVISNSIRIREFVLTRKISVQKDTDDITGLKNKGALTRDINMYLADPANDKGILLMLDIDGFKRINDTYGHDVGDDVISDLGAFLRERFNGDEIVGRFGGDEFIIFIKGTDDADEAVAISRDLLRDASERAALPDKEKKVSACIGIAIYRGKEKNYSEIFKKADIALYEAKSDPTDKIRIYGW